MTEAQRSQLHAAYLALPSVEDQDPVNELRALAREFGVKSAEARRLAHVEGWDLERRAARGRAWLASDALGARTEEEFIERCSTDRFSHIARSGPVGARYVEALARLKWRSMVGPVMEFEAMQAFDTAASLRDAA